MNKCKYAYDKSEACCADCNGEWFIINNEKIDSIECESFEPEIMEDNTPPWEEKQEENDTSKELNKIAENIEHAQTQNKHDLSVEKENSINTLPTTEKREIDTIELTTDASNNYISNATVKTITYSSSCTVEVKGTYYKFTACEEWELNDNCDVEKEREALWNKINEEVDKQVKEIL